MSQSDKKFLWKPEDLNNWHPAEKLGTPGKYPFTRGIYSQMYRSRLWTIRQYAGYGSAQQTNERFRYLLANGQTGLSVAFDLPTQMGFDSDDVKACGEVGRTGVAIDSLEDMERLFEGIDLSRVSTSMTINATAAILLSMYACVAARQGVAGTALHGTVQNDILKEYEARNTYIYPPPASMRLVTDIFAYCAEHMPAWNTISISGYHIAEAGATARQELAFTFANAIEYVKAALARGLNIDQFAGQLSFFFVAQMDLFEEIAKFRAARRLWARIMKDRFGAKNEKSLMLRFHVQTAGSSLTQQQPDNNVVRTTIEALAAALGGCQSLHTNAKDEALCLPSEAAALTALRSQQIIAFESGISNIVDPLGGSYFIEEATDRMEAAVEEYLQKIESLGGAIKAVESGYIQKEIQESAFAFHQDVLRGARTIVGVNKFIDKQAQPIAILKIDPEIETEQRRRLQQLKARRDQGQVSSALAQLKQAAEGKENLMPFINTAVVAYATVGEISAAMKAAFGQYRPLACL